MKTMLMLVMAGLLCGCGEKAAETQNQEASIPRAEHLELLAEDYLWYCRQSVSAQMEVKRLRSKLDTETSAGASQLLAMDLEKAEKRKDQTIKAQSEAYGKLMVLYIGDFEEGPEDEEPNEPNHMAAIGLYRESILQAAEATEGNVENLQEKLDEWERLHAMELPEVMTKFAQ